MPEASPPASVLKGDIGFFFVNVVFDSTSIDLTAEACQRMVAELSAYEDVGTNAARRWHSATASTAGFLGSYHFNMLTL